MGHVLNLLPEISDLAAPWCGTKLRRAPYEA